ncbi:hypothetical protein Tco_0799158 [Tanacetum coccineum]
MFILLRFLVSTVVNDDTHYHGFVNTAANGIDVWFLVKRRISRHQHVLIDKETTVEILVLLDLRGRISTAGYELILLALSLKVSAAAYDYEMIASQLQGKLCLYNEVRARLFTRRTIDQSASGKLRDRNAKESWALLEDLALYDNEIWNDPRDFAKPVKEIALPQDVLSTSVRRLIELKNQVQLVPMTLSIAWKIPSKPLLNMYPCVPMKREVSLLQTGMGIEPQQPKEPQPTLKEEFQDLHLNLPVLEVLAHAPIYNAILYKYVESLELGKNRSTFVQGEVPAKMEDPGLFTLPCRLGDLKFFDTLADLGSCINIIPLYLFKKLNIGLLQKTDHIFGLADGTKSTSLGLLET